ncbi:MAG: hypothetical protein ACLPZR_17970, partial [Solirubrobacteraceae bacterium]
VRRLFSGSLSRTAARRFVRDSGARFLLADCRKTTSLTKLLGPLVLSGRRFGCAGVYQLR